MAKNAKFSFFSSSSPKYIPSSPSSFTSFPASPLNQTFTQSMVEETVEKAESVIRKWDPNTPSFTKIVSLFNHSRKEAKEFIRCVRDLRRAMHFLVSQDSQSPKLALAQTLMQIAMARLEKEFFQILSSNRDKLDPESVSGQSSISSNSEFEDVMGSDDDDDSDNEMRKAGESITKVEKASAVVMSDLFKFPEFVAKEKKSHERIFSLMDLQAAISDLWQDIEMIFHFDAVAGVKSQALTSLQKLKVSIHSALLDFESTIQKDSTKALTPGGGIHKLTRSTMSFISSLSRYSCVLSEILEDHPLPRNTRLLESYVRTPISQDEQHNHALSVHFAWLILILLCKLDTKAEHYKDVSLSYLFLANNLQLIIETVRSTHLRDLLGDDWLTNHDDKLSAYAGNYEIAAWSNVFMSLPEEPTDQCSAKRETLRSW